MIEHRLTQEELNQKLIAVNEEFHSGQLNYKQYEAKYNRTKNLNSLANQIKRSGARVEREKGYTGYYIYHGVNFTVGFNEASCETTWWEVNYAGDDVHPAVEECFEGFNKFDIKWEVLSALFTLDCELTRKEAENV